MERKAHIMPWGVLLALEIRLLTIICITYGGYRDSYIRHDPMHGLICGPPIHKKPGGDEEACDDHERYPS